MAYFGAAGTLGRPSMHAWLSRSTHGLRERLRAEPHGLVFTAPLALGADVSARDERMQAELKEASQMVSRSDFPYYPQFNSSALLARPALIAWHQCSSEGSWLHLVLLYSALVSSTDVQGDTSSPRHTPQYEGTSTNFDQPPQMA